MSGPMAVNVESNTERVEKNYVYFDKEESMQRLSKRLAYILRYGALKEGLTVDDNGFVDFDELCTLNLLRHHTPDEILEAIKSSLSYRKTQRYDYREKDGKVYVRAAYLRNFEKSPVHPGTQVKTLFESSMCRILHNLDDYDLEDFPEENILRLMIRRLKREKKLTANSLRVLLAPTITHLDLEGVFLTMKTLRCVWTQCPHLRAVSLKDCGYIITDNVLTQFAKNLPGLERLNLCQCSHLTDRALAAMAKHLAHLHTLHMAQVPNLSGQAVLKFLRSAASLRFLDIYYLRVSLPEFKALTEAAAERSVTLMLKRPKAARQLAEAGGRAAEDSDDSDTESMSGSREESLDGDDYDAHGGDEDVAQAVYYGWDENESDDEICLG